MRCAICWLALLALAACDHPPEGARPLNSRPSVRLTGGPLQGDSVSYTADFFWEGWDVDGFVDHYQYAIDIPDRFTLADINSLADSGVAWVDTTATRAHFLFATPVQDSVFLPDLTVVLPDRYRGDHTLYVRSVDNEGLPSEADFVGFTARTLTPRTTITLPRVAPDSPVLYVGRQITVSWEGVDPDRLGRDKRPAWYEWKLIPGVGEPSRVNVDYAVNVRPGPEFPWTRVGAGTTSLRLTLNPPEEYVLAIRAIDATGGTESKFYLGRNALVLACSDLNLGIPFLVVNERTLGQWTFPSDPAGRNRGGPVWEVEVPAGLCLSFEFTADAQGYGGVIQGYNYGVDVPDAEMEGSGSGFRGWSAYPGTFDPICFATGGVHTITFKCRDTGGGVVIGTIIAQVIDFPMDREVLYIDDFSYAGRGLVTDAMMDARAREMLQAVGPDDGGSQEVYQWDTYGAGDLDWYPTEVKLSRLGRYRLVVWSVWGAGSGGNTSLARAASCSAVLRSYVQAGGAVWFYGEMIFGTFKRLIPSMQDCVGTIGYGEKKPLDFTPGSFMTDNLHITGGGFWNINIDGKRDGMLRGVPTAEAQAEFFPVVEIDSTVYAAGTRGALEGIDVMTTPTFTTGLDTLYTMVTPSPTSKYRNRAVAFRYLDPDPGSTMGPLAIFGFPFHLLKQGAVQTVQTDEGMITIGTGVQGMAASMVRWLHRHQRVVRGG